MRRRLIAMLLVSSTVVSVNGSIAAPICESVEDVYGDTIWVCKEERTRQQPGAGGAPGAAPAAPAAAASTGPGDDRPLVPRMLTGPDGEDCYGLVASSANGPRYYTNYEFQQLTTAQPCPTTDGDEADVAPINPRAEAEAFWASVPLDDFTVDIPPGHAITGLPAYVVTDSTLTRSFEYIGLSGPVRITARAELRIDWGDGTRTGPHHSPGRPYPNGDVGHTYTHRGHYDIVVTQHWTGTWRSAGGTGPLAERPVTTRIEDYPVREVQAVVEY
jgi:hypothetical protein